jgi:hypothetical protein
LLEAEQVWRTGNKFPDHFCRFRNGIADRREKSHISSQKYQIAAIATTAKIIHPMGFHDIEVPAVVALAKKPLAPHPPLLTP